jgi:hypothetical protein
LNKGIFMRAHRHRFLAVLVCGIAVASSAAGEDLPVRRAGLWEVTITHDDGKLPAQVMQQCTDAQTDKLMFAFSGELGAELCSRQDIRKVGGTLVIDATCKIGPMTLISQSVVSGDFNKSYTMKVTPKVKGAPAIVKALGGSSTTIKARWIGACKPDQRPGDIVLPGGKTVNIRDFKKLLGGRGTPSR